MSARCRRWRCRCCARSRRQLIKGATHNLIARTRPDVALYVLNQKRAHLRGLEERFSITITVIADETVTAPQAFVIDRGEQVHTHRGGARDRRADAGASPRRSKKRTTSKTTAAAESEDAEAAAEATLLPSRRPAEQA